MQSPVFVPHTILYLFFMFLMCFCSVQARFRYVSILFSINSDKNLSVFCLQFAHNLIPLCHDINLYKELISFSVLQAGNISQPGFPLFSPGCNHYFFVGGNPMKHVSLKRRAHHQRGVQLAVHRHPRGRVTVCKL